MDERGGEGEKVKQEVERERKQFMEQLTSTAEDGTVRQHIMCLSASCDVMFTYCSRQPLSWQNRVHSGPVPGPPHASDLKPHPPNLRVSCFLVVWQLCVFWPSIQLLLLQQSPHSSPNLQLTSEWQMPVARGLNLGCLNRDVEFRDGDEERRGRTKSAVRRKPREQRKPTGIMQFDVSSCT